MNKTFYRSIIQYGLALFAVICFSPISAQQTSSIYLDSRVVADYIRNSEYPYIDASKLSRPIANKVKVFTEKNDRLDFTTNGTFSMVDKNQGYHIVLDLTPNDTVFLVGGCGLEYLTSKSPDSLIIYPYFEICMTEADTAHHILGYPNRGISYGPRNTQDVYQALYKLANHSPHNSTRDWGWIDDYWLEQLKANYAKNPFFSTNTFGHQSIQAISFEFDDEIQERDKFYEFFKKEYPWQAVLNGDSILNFEQQVSFETQNSSYRDQIITAEKALSLASEQIDRTGRKSGLLDAKTVAVGLSDFIAERAQEELNLTFFDRFKTNMLDTNELTVLFPNTRDLLIDFEISNYKTLLSHARTTFETDLDNIALNFPKILALPRYEKLRNDPSVYNLALIYSMADLTYQERPIEDVILYTCQSLDSRKNELQKSISYRLGSQLTAQNRQPSEGVAIDTLQLLEKQAIQLLDTLGEVNWLISQTCRDLYYLIARAEINPDLDDFVNTRTGELYSEEWSNVMEWNQIHTRLYKQASIMGEYDWNSFYGSKIEQVASKEIQLRKQMLGGAKVDLGLNGYYRDRIPTYLRGEQYYQELISYDLPDRSHYDAFFRDNVDNRQDNLVHGIELLRSLRNEPITTYLEEQQQELHQLIEGSRQIEYRYLTGIDGTVNQFERLKEIGSKYDLLLETFVSENAFWSNFLSANDQSLFGLTYLQYLFSSEESFYTIQEVIRTYAPEFDGELGRYIYENHEKSDGELLYEAEEKLVEYHLLLKEQLMRIYSTNSAFVNQQNLELKKERSELELQRFLVVTPLEEGMISIRNQMNRIQQQNEDANGLTALMEAYYKDYSAVSESDLQSLYDAATEQTHQDTTYLELEQELDMLGTEYGALAGPLNQKLVYFYEEAFEEREATAGTPIDEIVLDSVSCVFLKLYEEKSLTEKEDEVGKMADLLFHDIDAQFIQIKPAIKKVQDLQNQLKNTLSALEQHYCPDLLKAERNAHNMRTSMELSMHLLSAFRNPVAAEDSMYIADTTVMKITLNQTNGIVQSYDTLRVDRKYVSDDLQKLPGSRWMTRKEFEQLKNDPLQWEIFLGMLYQRMSLVDDAPDFSAAGTALLATKFFDMLHQMDNHRQAVRLRKALGQQLGFKDYYPFVRTTVDMFNTVINTPVVGDGELAVAQQFTDLQKISELSDQALSLYENMYIKDYGNAIRNAMSLLSIFTNSTYDPALYSYDRNLSLAAQLDASKRDKRQEEKIYRDNTRSSRRTINAVLTYGTFMADMIDAETSDQVKTILKAATLPPGSSRIKREVNSNFTVNAYLGGAVAYDKIQDDLPGLDQGALGASLSVPIGFTYSFSPDKIFKRGGSFSIFVPLFDLGAITAFRSKPANSDYQLEQLPDFTWRNLFSPGAFFVWNIQNSPFSLGAGGQIGPQLRQITDVNTNITSLVNSTRFPMIFFSIDVPFFNLHTGPKKIAVD